MPVGAMSPGEKEGGARRQRGNGRRKGGRRRSTDDGTIGRPVLAPRVAGGRSGVYALTVMLPPRYVKGILLPRLLLSGLKPRDPGEGRRLGGVQLVARSGYSGASGTRKGWLLTVPPPPPSDSGASGSRKGWPWTAPPPPPSAFPSVLGGTASSSGGRNALAGLFMNGWLSSSACFAGCARRQDTEIWPFCAARIPGRPSILPARFDSIALDPACRSPRAPEALTPLGSGISASTSTEPDDSSTLTRSRWTPLPTWSASVDRTSSSKLAFSELSDTSLS
mmetsp:Transcript_25667/g.68531  ORF Transcript_25667/g.68531 Transcript_25667/m.68531 type:complete len:279 (+) Transcript_25667:268-1104(+)